MANPVIMPRQGQSVETCIITQWHKKPGDQVDEGDVLFSYETDKASFEEESKEKGVLLTVFYEEGDEVPVLTNVAVIGQEGESTDEFNPETAEQEQAAPAKEEPAEDKKKQPQEAASTTPVTSQYTTDNDLKISPRAKKMAEKIGVPVNNIKGSGPEGRIIARDIDEYAARGGLNTSLAGTMAKENELQSPATGTGIGNRVRSTDLVQSGATGGDDFEIEKLSNMRKIIAEKMQQSLQNSAQLTHHISADARKILSLRKAFKKMKEEGKLPNITINDMVCFAVVKALMKFPAANSHFMGDHKRLFKKVHLGIAVDTERGLMVPALKNADELTIESLAEGIKGLAGQCRKGNVDPELLSSEAATFTITNLGSFGTEMFTPVLNIPQTAILGVNTISYKPSDLGDGNIGFVPHIGLSLTYDHRSLDGAPAAAFLQEIKIQVEQLSVDI
jgi:pyruvate dehydrogenase E2 component (dihydrolipoamide acetyltransferase)